MTKKPDFRLNKDVTFQNGSVTLSQHSFVCPVKWAFLPRHVQVEWSMWRTSKDHFMCYTKIGFVPILKTDIDEV